MDVFQLVLRPIQSAQLENGKVVYDADADFISRSFWARLKYGNEKNILPLGSNLICQEIPLAMMSGWGKFGIIWSRC